MANIDTVIYFDNAATTKPAPEALEEMQRLSRLTLGNASSNHSLGVQAATVVEKARMRIARAIGADPEEILFTSSGTESNNLAIKGFCFANRGEKNHIIVSAIEHACVSGAVEWMAKQGFRLSVIGVDSEGRIDLGELENLITPQTLLVTIMHGNNEVGVIQDLQGITDLCKKHEIAFHSDAVQSFLKVPIDLKKTPVTMMTISSHKVHGPRGVAALFVRKGTHIEPLHHGGGQERNLRSGTLNVEGAAGFAKAVEVFDKSTVEQMIQLKREFLSELEARIPIAMRNGPLEESLCNIINFSLPGFTSKDLIRELQKKNIYVSAGSACLSQKATGSFVVRALGKDEDLVQSALRVSLSRNSTRHELDQLLEALEVITAPAQTKELECSL